MVHAAREGRSVRPVLRRLCPHIYRQIVADAKQRGILSAWGRSCNVDENAGQVIVAPPILRSIGELARVPMRGRFVHAGLEHTYGYLFSLIETPYGFKRDRWLTTGLERGFDIERSLLGDRPRQGTLLANLTWFLAHVAFREQLPSSLARDASAVAPELIAYDYSRLRVSRVVERVILPSRRAIFLFTDLVPFLDRTASAENTLLVYSVQTGARQKLITAFPVTRHVAAELKTPIESDRRVAIRLRYNAYVPGLFGRTLQGHRYVEAPKL
jgi:hypothetical protein